MFRLIGDWFAFYFTKTIANINIEAKLIVNLNNKNKRSLNNKRVQLKTTKNNTTKTIKRNLNQDQGQSRSLCQSKSLGKNLDQNQEIKNQRVTTQV